MADGQPTASRGAGRRAGAPRSRAARACAGVGGPRRRALGRCWCERHEWRERRIAATATPSAAAVTTPTVDIVRDGAPTPPRSPAPGSASKGAASHAAASPAAAASSASSTYSASSTTATRRGVPPTALSSPTRRVWSAMRPPTSTATLAAASNPSSQLPIRRTSSRTCAASSWPCADALPCLQDRGARVEERGVVRRRREVSVDERRRVGRVRQLQVHDVGHGFLCRGETAGVRLGEPDQAGLDRRRPESDRCRRPHPAAAPPAAGPQPAQPRSPRPWPRRTSRTRARSTRPCRASPRR